MFKKCVYARILMDMWANTFVLGRLARDESLLVIVISEGKSQSGHHSLEYRDFNDNPRAGSS